MPFHTIAQSRDALVKSSRDSMRIDKGLNADLLEMYATDRELQFTLPDVLKVPPISQHGNVAEIAQRFGGIEKLGTAVNQLQSLLYAA